MILLHGTGTHNKGAELMAIAVLEHFRTHPNPPEFAVPPSFGTYRDRAQYGVFTLLPRVSPLRRTGFALRLLRASFLNRFGLATLAEIDTVIDASGYFFGDPFCAKDILAVGRLFEAVKRRGGRVILMPQSFGPFSRHDIREACQKTLALCDLILAREQSSFENLRQLALDESRINQFPDFTCSVGPDSALLQDANAGKPDILLVPNRQIKLKLGDSVYRSYLECYRQVIEFARQHKFTTAFLLHCTSDIEVCTDIESGLCKSVPIISYPNPKTLKAVLGSARVVVTSRYHAAVSSLSQAVPVITIGWAEKYSELLREFQCEEYSSMANEYERTVGLLDTLLHDDKHYSRLRLQIGKAAEAVSNRVRVMWEYVDALIKK